MTEKVHPLMVPDNDAHEVLGLVRKQFATWIGARPGPELIRDYESNHGLVRCALLWEEGPDRWVYDIDKDLPGWPETVYTEPVNDFVLGVFKEF